ncbi:hypothetical protein SAY86_029379 [Trapa natans]|uniref:Uncharacterized protein n=1 Tax=Trapa natans TaxID=22666 RepID=A0AAN7LWD7_TRANT|nr:hypothetical protein SAY86_029379 [Trapa natans]
MAFPKQDKGRRGLLNIGMDASDSSGLEVGTCLLGPGNDSAKESWIRLLCVGVWSRCLLSMEACGAGKAQGFRDAPAS